MSMHILRLLIVPFALFATVMGACEHEPLGTLDGETLPDELSFAPGEVPIIFPIDDPRPGPVPPPRPGPRGLIAEADVRGTGCPDGTASADIAADGRTVRVTYDPGSFRAETGDLTETRKSCTAVMTLNLPRDTTVAVRAVNHTGRVSLAGGVSALLRTSYRFTGGGAAEEASTEERFDRGDNGNFRVRSVFDRGDLVFAPCGGADPQLVITTEVASGDLRSRAGSSIEMRSSTFFEFATRDCR
jgi:hypothetical protein